jgi:hypothetical protein
LKGNLDSNLRSFSLQRSLSLCLSLKIPLINPQTTRSLALIQRKCDGYKKKKSSFLVQTISCHSIRKSHHQYIFEAYNSLNNLWKGEGMGVAINRGGWNFA